MRPDEEQAAVEYDGIAMIVDWPPHPETRPDKTKVEKR